MNIDITRDKILLILKWFENKFSKSKFCKTFPKLRVYKSKGNSDYEDKEYGIRGKYDSDTITIHIYLGTIKSVKILCNTVAHEYKHYKLNSKEYDKIYYKLRKSGLNPDDIHRIHHPHEKKCDRFEKKWGLICFNELKNKLYKL
jgi:hypothetical protein